MKKEQILLYRFNSTTVTAAKDGTLGWNRQPCASSSHKLNIEWGTVCHCSLVRKGTVPPSLTPLRNQIAAGGTCADKAAWTSQQLWWSPLLLFHLVYNYPRRIKGGWKAIMPKKGDGYYLSRSILRLYCLTFPLWLFGKVAPFPSVILSCPLLEKLSTECAELNFWNWFLNQLWKWLIFFTQSFCKTLIRNYKKH